MDGMITLIVHLHAKPEQLEVLEEALHALVVDARKEAGCVDFHFHRDAKDPNHIVFYENWRSRKDLEEHLQTPIQVSFGKVVDQYLVKKIDMQYYEMISPYNKLA